MGSKGWQEVVANQPERLPKGSAKQTKRTWNSLEADVLHMIRKAGIQEPVRELKVIPGRDYRFDFAWPDARVCLEVDGGTLAKGSERGAHSRPTGQMRDAKKARLASMQGWVVVRVTTMCLQKTRIVESIREVGEVVRFRTEEMKRMREKVRGQI